MQNPAQPPISLRMTQTSGREGVAGAMMNEGGPWGDGPPSEPSRNPWVQPPSPKKPRPVQFDAGQFGERLKARMGGDGGGDKSKLIKLGGAALVAGWLMLTSFHSIGPQERGVVTRLGKYERTLPPGISMTLPAPIDLVKTVDVQNIRSIDIPDGAGEKLVLTRDENIINLDYTVRWSIKDPALYLFELADPDQTIAQVAESAMRAAVANVSLDDAIGAGRTGIENEVSQRMQAILDSYRSGVRVDGVAIKAADPPEAVNDAFKEVSAAQQAAQTSINQANAYAQQIIAKAQGEAAAFDRMFVQYQAAPEVTRRRMYYETMERVLAKTDKTLVDGVTPYLPLNGTPRRETPVPVQEDAR